MVNVNFENSFKIEEEETTSIKPLFLDTMKQVTTLENDSDRDQFENVEIISNPAPIQVTKMDSSNTAHQMNASRSNWNGLNEQI
jgi:hypothetical protein